LTHEWTPDIEIKMVMVKECINNWTQHVGENVLTNEEDRVSNHDKGEFNDLPQAEGSNRILVMQERFTEAELCVVDNWVNVTILV